MPAGRTGPDAEGICPVPKYEQAYLRAFEKMLKARAGNGKPYQKWQTADDVMRWWLSEEKQQKVDEDQLSFFLLDA